MPESGKLVVALLAVPESTASTLYGMFEVLESAGRDWGMVTEGVPGDSKIRPLIVSADGREFDSGNGLRIAPSCSLERCPPPDVVAIPDLAVMPNEDVSGRYAQEVAWLQRLARAGSPSQPRAPGRSSSQKPGCWTIST
jgi:transcriptional regulator GlxA family with amidase domain